MMDTNAIVRLRASYEESADGCWIWRGKCGGRSNAAIFAYRGTYVSARRAVYEVEREVELTPAVKLYETCGDKRCVNPAHMELRTGGTLTRERCHRGHDITNEANIYVTTQGKRTCRQCIRITCAERRERYEREGRGWGRHYRKVS